MRGRLIGSMAAMAIALGGVATGCTGTPSATEGAATTEGVGTGGTSAGGTTSPTSSTSSSGANTSVSGGNGAGGTITAPGAPGLEDGGLVLRYWLNDGVEVVDSSTNGLDLPVVPFSTPRPLEAVDVAGHHGIRFGGAGGHDCPTALVNEATRAALHQTTALTVEMVVEYQASDEELSPLSLIEFSPNFSLKLAGPRLMYSYITYRTRGRWRSTFAPHRRQVFHYVMDTTQSSVAARSSLFVNGAPSASLEPSEILAGNTTISVTATAQVALGCAPSGAASFGGIIYYAAVYNEAFDATRVFSHANQLLINDDSPPL